MAFSFRRVIILLTFGCILLMLISLPMIQLSSKRSNPFWNYLVFLEVGNESICSDKATSRGPGQKVVAFSIYGPINNKRQYFIGIEANAKQMAEFYEGWVMRVYHDASEEEFIRHSLHEMDINYPYLDICDVRRLSIGDYSSREHMTWRFLPLIDPLVEVMASRDLDSRFSQREEDAVKQWLSSNYSFHVMRDHPYHSTEMLAGMWGARKDLEPEFVQDTGYELIKSFKKDGKKDEDQRFLDKYVWIKIKDRVMQHDSYYCTRKEYQRWGGMTPYPTQRINDTLNYVGCITVNDYDQLKEHCPIECRPKEHRDWVVC